MLLPLMIFGLYGVIILYYSNKNYKLRINDDLEFFPFVSVVIPTHNEEYIISKKIENIFNSKYPENKLELIFVDDSTDHTAEIIEEYGKNRANIHLIKSPERMGYSPSMLKGCRSAQGEILILTDAHSFFDDLTIYNLIQNFKDPEIGAVSSRSIILNPEDEVAKSEGLYMTLYNKMRIAETIMYSTFWFKGEASAVRRDIVKDIDECSASFDTTVAIFSRKMGYKTIFDPNVKFYEYAPVSGRDRVKQKTIRAANILKILFFFRDMLFNKEFGKFGSVILPFNYGMLVITPLSLLMGLMLLGILTILDFTFSIYIWASIFILFFFLTIVYKPLVITFVDFTYSLLKALYQMYFTKIEHDKVEKIMSTRRT